MCIRPHGLKLEPTADRGNAVEGIVDSLQWQGQTETVGLNVNGTIVRLTSTELRQLPKIGDRLTLYFATEDAILIPEDAPTHA